MPEAVLFDLDNTLYDERKYVFGILDAFCANQGLDTQQAQAAYGAELAAKSPDILGGILKRLNCYTPELQETLFHYYQTAPVKVELYGDAVSVLNILRDKGVKTGILTNGACEAQRNKVRCLGVEKLVDKVIYARDFGAAREKPHDTGYHALLNVLEVSAENSVFVGDTLQTDIEGANRANIPAVLIRRSDLGTPLADTGDDNATEFQHSVEDLEQLLEILETL